MLDQEKFDWKFEFKLMERCSYATIENSNSIKLITETDGKTKYITGFSILIKDSTECEAITKANRQAKVLADIISVNKGRHLSQYMVGYNMNKKDGTEIVTSNCNFRYNIFRDLNLNLRDKIISSMIKNDLPVNQQYHHASLGLRASEFGLYDVMIKEFYQVIEHDLTNESAKFKPLRDALSHPSTLQDPTINALNKNFEGHFKLTRNNQFDYNSPENNEYLKIEANKLMKIAMDYIKNEFSF